MDDDNRVRKSKRVAGGAGRPNGGTKKLGRGKHKQGSAVLIDFNRWEMETLKKYSHYFNLETSPKPLKSELVSIVRKHFVHSPKLREADVVADFLYANNRAKQKQRHRVDHS